LWQNFGKRAKLEDMPRTVWFHCFSGIAGDMALGALLDAGADLGEVKEILGRLPVSGWELTATPTVKVGLGATQVRVRNTEGDNVVRTYAHTTGLLEEGRLPPRVLMRAQATFAALAEAYGHIRNQPVERLHFHEIGDLASIIEIVGVCAALEVLDIDEIHASPVAQGMGLVPGEHGLQPTPSPIVMALLTARDIPSFGLDIPQELTTPTGAALLRALCDDFGALPDMRVSATGYGAGSRDINGITRSKCRRRRWRHSGALHWFIARRGCCRRVADPDYLEARTHGVHRVGPREPRIGRPSSNAAHHGDRFTCGAHDQH
jgi:pyridinium-3,5-bisthiocarboxylic acid mononucleotide nickel chelatase